jgi:hypothetical protein
LLGCFDTDQKRGATTGSDKLLWKMGAFKNQSKCTFLAIRKEYQFFDNRLNQIGKRQRNPTITLLSIINVLCKLGDTFCISFRFKSKAKLLEDSTQFLVIGDNAIVNNGKLVFRIRSVWMTVNLAWGAMSRPSGVRDLG